MQFFSATVKGLKSDEDRETILTLRVPGSEYDKVSTVGKLVKTVLVIGVFTEDEFMKSVGFFRGSSDVESSRGDADEYAA